MRAIPAEVLLSWPNPNYASPVTRGNTLIVVNSVFLALVVIVVSLRLYTRIWIKRWFGADDTFIVLALISTIGLTTVVLLANQNYGWDRHVYDIPLNKLAPTSQIAMSAKVLFTAAATFTRLSLLFFYYRLIKDSHKRIFRWAVHANVVYSIGIFFTFVSLSIFQCTPVSMYWTFGAPEGSCLDEGAVTMIAGIINLVADFFCTVTPIPLVVRLKMPRSQRVAVTILFSLGFIVTIAGIVRTWYIYKSLVKEYDQTWYAYPLWIAAAIEIHLGVICASAPVLRPLLVKIPNSLSTITSGITFNTRSGASISKGSNTNRSDTVQSSKAGQSDIDSNRGAKRQNAGITAERMTKRNRDLELETWQDVECGVPEVTSVSSEDAILENADEDGLPRQSWSTQGGTASDTERYQENAAYGNGS